MFEKKVIPHSISTRAFETYTPTLPLLSSVEAGWEGVMVRTYNEPMESEGVTFPAVPDVSLVMVTQGAVALERRDVGGSWNAFHVGAGDWSLTPGGGLPYEFRWRPLSSEPIQSLYVHINTDLISRAASHLTKSHPHRVELGARLVFQDLATPSQRHRSSPDPDSQSGWFS